MVGRPSAFFDMMTPHILQDVIIQSLVAAAFLREEAFKMPTSKCFSNRKQEFLIPATIGSVVL